MDSNLHKDVPALIRRLITSLVENEKQRSFTQTEFERTYFPSFIQEKLHDGLIYIGAKMSYLYREMDAESINEMFWNFIRSRRYI
jgi:hypothetical protein